MVSRWSQETMPDISLYRVSPNLFPVSLRPHRTRHACALVCQEALLAGRVACCRGLLQECPEETSGSATRIAQLCSKRSKHLLFNRHSVGSPQVRFCFVVSSFYLIHGYQTKSVDANAHCSLTPAARAAGPPSGSPMDPRLLCEHSSAYVRHLRTVGGRGRAGADEPVGDAGEGLGQGASPSRRTPFATEDRPANISKLLKSLGASLRREAVASEGR